nr:hypothetical protein [Marispirochaeta sp.]
MTTGNDIENVRVVLELPAPGMQYAEESRNIPRKPGLFGSKFFHDTGRGGEKGGTNLKSDSVFLVLSSTGAVTEKDVRM